MDKKKSVTEAIYSICSYESLGHTTNYDASEATTLSRLEFNKQKYSNLFSKYQADDQITESIHKRKSARIFSATPINEDEIIKILFNAYSLKDNNGSFTIPQAGGLGVMKLNVLTNKNHSWGISSYNHLTYELINLEENTDNITKLFYTKSIDFNTASHCIIISCNLNAFSKVYLARAFKFSCFQAGHIAQNIILVATLLGIKTIALGSLVEEEIKKSCHLDVDQYPLYAVILGK